MGEVRVWYQEHEDCVIAVHFYDAASLGYRPYVCVFEKNSKTVRDELCGFFPMLTERYGVSDVFHDVANEITHNIILMERHKSETASDVVNGFARKLDWEKDMIAWWMSKMNMTSIGFGEYHGKLGDIKNGT